MTQALFSHRKHWAARFGTAPFLPMSRAEMAALGWDACDIILVTGDAYIDHPSFGMALIGRLLEAQGYRVGIISQPDWHSADAFRALGQPTLYFGVTAGNMDSMVNRYTSDRKIRSDDAYTPNAEPNKRPDRAVTVYAQRCREAYPGTPIIIGSIEASLRRIAHYDYWSDTVRRSVLPDSKADLLIFGNAERALLEVSHRLAKGEKIGDIRDVRGTGFMVTHDWKPAENWLEVMSTELDTPGAIDAHVDPYAMTPDGPTAQTSEGADTIKAAPVRIVPKAERLAAKQAVRERTVIRLPDYDQVKNNPTLYAHASRVFHLESNRATPRAAAGARRARRLAQSAADPADHTGDGCGVRPALRARAASELRRRQNPRLGDDPLLGQHHARLLRRLHLLLDHRARGPHHPEPQRRFGHQGNRGHPRQDTRLHRRHFRPRRANGQHVPHGL
jgi:uncharacterized radical SAM protein YgiQ